MTRPLHFAPMLSLWALPVLLAGCTIRLPLAELCQRPAWQIAVADQWRCYPAEPSIIVPRGAEWDDLG